MWMWPLLFMLPLFAQDRESEKYCFSSAVKREKMHRELKAILLPADQVTVSGDCLTVMMKPHRRELIQNYIRTHEPDVAISFSSAEIKRESCKIKVEKIKTQVKKTTDASADGTVNPFAVQATATETNAESKETMQIQTLKDFELQSNQDVIKGQCRYITPTRYEITLSVHKDPKPLLPPVPPGTIVHVTTPPPDQETASLTTTVQLTQGSRIEIGSVVRDMKTKNHDIKIDPKVDYDDRSNSTTEEIYLSID